MKLCYTVKPEDSGKTLKYHLKYHLEVSGSLVKRLKMNHKILCNSSPVHINAPVVPGDLIEVIIDAEEQCEHIIPENINLDILFEDECIIVINKQPFIVVHPTCGHQSGTIANALMYHFLSNGTQKIIRPVSRLDRDTSGIIIFAKNEFVQESLIRQMKGKSFTKEYFGVVHGLIKETLGTIDLPIDRKPESIMLRHISHSGSTAVTHYEVLKYLNNATFLKFSLETGRTHQIRVHCQAIGHPLIGDTLYPFLPQHNLNPSVSPQTVLINRQALHSFKVVFNHPISKERMEITARIPDDFKNLLRVLQNITYDS